jgi:hypothetical protein
MNKSALRAQFKALLNRNDCTNDLADIFIDQAVGRIQRTLRVPSMERSAIAAFSDALPDSVVLPNDFLEFIDVYFDNGVEERKLEKMPRASFMRVPRVGGSPRAYIRTGKGIEVRPAPVIGSQINLLYYAEVPDLVNDDDTNVFSDISPELVIYGALSYAGDYFVDDRKPVFEEVFLRTYSELEEQARSLEFSGADMSVQSTYPGAEY